MNTPHSPFAVGKTTKLSAQTCPRMSKVAHGCILVSQNGAEVYCGQSSSWSVFLFVVVSRSSRSVFLVVVFGWGKPRSMSGQMYGGITPVGGIGKLRKINLCFREVSRRRGMVRVTRLAL